MIEGFIKKIKYFSFRTPHQQGFLEDLALLIDDGVPAKKAVEMIATTSKDISREVAEAISEKISEGRFIADGMYGWFPNYIVELVRAGEEGGTLISTMQIAVEALAKKNSLIKTLLGAIAYPIVVLIMGLGVSVYVNHSIFDNFRQIVPMERWPDAGRDLAYFSNFMESWWWLLFIFIMAAIVGVIVSLRHYVGHGRPFIDKAPMLNLYRRLIAARFMQTLGLLISNGVVFKKALKILQYNADPYLAWHLLTMEYRLGGGKENIAEVLDTGLIDEKDLTRLKIIAHGKGFEHALVRQGKRSLESTDTAMQRSARLLGAILLFFGASLAIFMIFGIYNVGSVVGRY